MTVINLDGIRGGVMDMDAGVPASSVTRSGVSDRLAQRAFETSGFDVSRLQPFEDSDRLRRPVGVRLLKMPRLPVPPDAKLATTPPAEKVPNEAARGCV